MPRYLTQREARDIDVKLMGTLRYSLEQLMELAGLSVASAVAKVYPSSSFKRVLVACGPGNNGGDALVAARHLALFGYSPSIWYPKETKKAYFLQLQEQCTLFGIPISRNLNVSTAEYDVVLDGVFGFSFDPSGGIRAPFDIVLDTLRYSVSPVVSIDVPSGWHVEQGDTQGIGVQPETLVSLTAPKMCAKGFKGRHYLGGRFIPPYASSLNDSHSRCIQEEYELELPSFPSAEQVVEIQ